MIGRHISHFYVIRSLGSGGMGEVYEAQDTRLPRSVAIKVLKPELTTDQDAVRRFKREARLSSSVNHPNICTILEVSEDESQSFIAMELLEGATLKTRLLGGSLPLADIVDVAGQVTDGLAAAHAQGIIHRDITPGNIFLAAGGLVKLLDFGLARHFPASSAGDQTSDDLTATGSVVGTIHYMSPEQLGDGPVDYRCDFFALGAVLYQMTTGARPFDFPSRAALTAAIRRQPHVPVRRLAPHVPVPFERIIDTLLAKNPDERYQSASALRAAIDDLGCNRAAPPRRPGTAVPVVIAVLPFHAIGAVDPAVISVAEGLTTDLASGLSRLPDVRVAPQTSIRALPGRTAGELVKTLGIDVMLDGAVQQAGGRVRVTANLVDARRERTLVPSLVVDCDVSDALTMQKEIARQACSAVAAALSGRRTARSPREPDAYHAFKRGQHVWGSCFNGGWREAIDHFQHAIALDPDFARAHVALANAYNFLGFYAIVKPALAFAVAARSAARALEVEPRLGSAFIELALAKFGGDWDWEGSEQAFREGLTLEPQSPVGHVHYSWLLMLLGRDDAALAEAQRAHDLAPSSRLVAAARAQTLYMGGHYQQAIDLCDECLRFDPDYVFAVHLRGLCHMATATRELALADLERAAALADRAPFYVGILGRCYGQFGMRDEALGLIAELAALPQDTYVPPQCYVFIYAGLGERERALEYQEKAYQDGASPFNYLNPSIRSLYALSPHHKKRLEQMRLTLS